MLIFGKLYLLRNDLTAKSVKPMAHDSPTIFQYLLLSKLGDLCYYLEKGNLKKE